MDEEAPVKKGRGRPKGSLNKKNLQRTQEQDEQEEIPVPFTLDVDFESNEILGADEEEPPSPPPPKPKRRASRKAPPPPPESEEDELEEPPPPKPKPKRAAAKRSTAKIHEPTPMILQLTYLEVLTRGLKAAQATQKAQKVARYDAYLMR